jgi:hypothetical protein
MANEFTTKIYTNVRQPEIDHIRQTGKSPELGLWDQVAQYAKYKGSEWANDLLNDNRYDIDQYSDPDQIREQAFTQAKEQALRDHQSAKQGIPGPYKDASPWLSLKAGKYK